MNRLIIVGVSLLGLASLLLSLRSPWFDVPTKIQKQSGAFIAVKAEPGSTHYFQVAAAGVSLYVLAAWLLGGRWRRTMPLALACWLATLVMFPWTVMVLSPSIAARANWLQIQHENLTWLGGDLPTSQEQAALNWKTRLVIVDAPERVSMIPVPSWNPWETGLNKLPQLFAWTGYENTFCQFARRSWMLAIFGTTCLLITGCFRRGRLSIIRLRGALLLTASLTMVACIVACSLQFMAGNFIERAADSARNGDYAGAIDDLEQAARFSPTLLFDTDYVVQRGLLDHLTGDKTLSGAIVHAHLLERGGRTSEANQIYSDVLMSTQGDKCSPLRREACQGLLRSAIHALNSGNEEQAIPQLEYVLHLEPCHLKANYVLQLAYLNTGKREAMLELVDQLNTTYECFKFPNKKVVLAAAQQNAAYAAFQKGDTHEAWQRAVTAKNP